MYFVILYMIINLLLNITSYIYLLYYNKPMPFVVVHKNSFQIQLHKDSHIYEELLQSSALLVLPVLGKILPSSDLGLSDSEPD